MKKIIPQLILVLIALKLSAQSANYDCICQYLQNDGRMMVDAPQVYKTGIKTGYGSNVDQKSKWSVIEDYIKTIDANTVVADEIHANVEQLLSLISQADAQGYDITGLRIYFAILTKTGVPKLDNLTQNERNQLSLIWVPTKKTAPAVPLNPDLNYKGIDNEDVCFYIVPKSTTSSVVMLKGSEVKQWVANYQDLYNSKTNINIGTSDVTPPYTTKQTEAKSLWYSMPQLLKLAKLINCQISKNGKLTKQSALNIFFAGHDQKLDDFVNYDNKLKRIDASKQITILLNIEDMPTSECIMKRTSQLIDKILESWDKDKDNEQYRAFVALNNRINNLENFREDKELEMKKIRADFQSLYFTVMGGPGGPLSDFDTALPCPPAVCIELEP